MKHFKFRAEILQDVCDFISKFRLHNNESLFDFLIFPLEKELPDVTITFSTDLDKEQIIDILLSIDDSHVMIETLEFLENYTGLR